MLPHLPYRPRSVPHILSDESSAYYHGYVLAEMAVHQTRAHFLSTYGRIVDEPRVGADLANVYWAPGSGEAFLDLVARLTGAPLTSAAWVKELQVGGQEGGGADGGRGGWERCWAVLLFIKSAGSGLKHHLSSTLSPTAAHALQTPLKQRLEEEEEEYKEAVAAGPAIPPGQEPDLDMRVVLVHGDATLADSAEGGLAQACKVYKEWIHKTYYAAAA